MTEENILNFAVLWIVCLLITKGPYFGTVTAAFLTGFLLLSISTIPFGHALLLTAIIIAFLSSSAVFQYKLFNKNKSND
jgi:cell division protein FtsW (lipid II flippase)